MDNIDDLELEQEKAKLTEQLIYMEENTSTDADQEIINGIKNKIDLINEELMASRTRAKELGRKQAREELEEIRSSQKPDRSRPAQSTQKIKPRIILLVEDNPGDIRLVIEAFKECSIPHRLIVVETGAQALSFLRRE